MRFYFNQHNNIISKKLCLGFHPYIIYLIFIFIPKLSNLLLYNLKLTYLYSVIDLYV